LLKLDVLKRFRVIVLQPFDILELMCNQLTIYDDKIQLRAELQIEKKIITKSDKEFYLSPSRVHSELSIHDHGQ
jgi:hypothetical protein